MEMWQVYLVGGAMLLYFLYSLLNWIVQWAFTLVLIGTVLFLGFLYLQDKNFLLLRNSTPNPPQRLNPVQEELLDYLNRNLTDPLPEEFGFPQEFDFPECQCSTRQSE